MKKISKNTGAKDKKDYFEIVRNNKPVYQFNNKELHQKIKAERKNKISD